MAVFAALSAVTGKDTADFVTVVVASRMVAAGSTLVETDVKLAKMPREAIPEGVLTQTQDAIGKITGTGIRPNQILTDLTLIGSTSGDGMVVLSVRLDNPELASLSPPGTYVTLFSTSSAKPVASHVLVAAIPATDNSNLLGGKSSKILLVRVSAEQAGAITMAMSSSTMTLAIG